MKMRKTLLAILVVAILSGATLGLRAVYYDYCLAKAEELLKAGYSSLAAGVLVSRMQHFVSSKEGCATLLTALHGANRGDDLQWAMEACTQNKIEIGEVLRAQIEVYNLRGDKPRAAASYVKLGFGVKDRMALFTAAHLYGQLDKPATALQLVDAAMKFEAAPDATTEVLALALYYEFKEWGRAKPLAEKLKHDPKVSGDPKVKRLIAETLKSQ